MVSAPFDFTPGFQGVRQVNERFAVDVQPKHWWLRENGDQQSGRLHSQSAYPFSGRLLSAILNDIEANRPAAVQPKPPGMAVEVWENNGFRVRPPHNRKGGVQS